MCVCVCVCVCVCDNKHVAVAADGAHADHAHHLHNVIVIDLEGVCDIIGQLLYRAATSRKVMSAFLCLLYNSISSADCAQTLSVGSILLLQIMSS